MARNRFVASTGNAAIAVTTTAKTVLLVKAPANISVAIQQISLAFDSNNAAQAGILVELVRFDTTGAGTSSTGTKTKKHTGSDTIQSTVNQNYSAEPTTGTVVDAILINPAGGVIIPFPLDGEIIAKGSESLGIRITLATGESGINVLPSIHCEE